MSTILVVDDQPAVRRLLGVVLEDAGFEVQQAEGGAEALEQVTTTPPSACVLDVMMPRVDGWEVLRALRANEATANLPIVMLTAKGDPQDRLRGWELGCDAYIPKPFDPPELIKEVNAVLALSPSERGALRERQRTVVRALVEGGQGQRNDRNARNGRKAG